MKDYKQNIVLGLSLFVLAALFTVSLLLQVLPNAADNILTTMGSVLYTTYGASSVIIPIFLIIAAVECFISDWTVRRSMRLLTAVVPFFTCVESEKLCHAIYDNPFEDFALIKICVVLGITALLVVIELLLATKLADKITSKTTIDSQSTSKTVTVESTTNNNVSSDKTESASDTTVAANDTVGATCGRDVPTSDTSSDFAPWQKNIGAMAKNDPRHDADLTNGTYSATSDTYSATSDTHSVATDTTGDATASVKSMDAFRDVFSEANTIGTPKKSDFNKDDAYALGSSIPTFSGDSGESNHNKNLIQGETSENSAQSFTQSQMGAAESISEASIDDSDYGDPMSVITQEEYATLTNSNYGLETSESDTDEIEWPNENEIKERAGTYNAADSEIAEDIKKKLINNIIAKNENATVGKSDLGTQLRDCEKSSEEVGNLESAQPKKTLDSPTGENITDTQYSTTIGEPAGSVYSTFIESAPCGEAESGNPYVVGNVTPYVPSGDVDNIDDIEISDTTISDDVIDAPDIISDSEIAESIAQSGDSGLETKTSDQNTLMLDGEPVDTISEVQGGGEDFDKTVTYDSLDPDFFDIDPNEIGEDELLAGSLYSNSGIVGGDEEALYSEKEAALGEEEICHRDMGAENSIEEVTSGEYSVGSDEKELGNSERGAVSNKERVVSGERDILYDESKAEAGEYEVEDYEREAECGEVGIANNAGGVVYSDKEEEGGEKERPLGIEEVLYKDISVKNSDECVESGDEEVANEEDGICYKDLSDENSIESVGHTEEEAECGEGVASDTIEEVLYKDGDVKSNIDDIKYGEKEEAKVERSLPDGKNSTGTGEGDENAIELLIPRSNIFDEMERDIENVVLVDEKTGDAVSDGSNSVLQGDISSDSTEVGDALNGDGGDQDDSTEMTIDDFTVTGGEHDKSNCDEEDYDEDESFLAERSSELLTQKSKAKESGAGAFTQKSEQSDAVRKSFNNYYVPSSLLAQNIRDPYWIIDEETKADGEKLRDTLQQFHIEAKIIGIKKGPVVTMFELSPAPGVKLSKIVTLQDNIALNLAAGSVRIVAPIPGKAAVGIEVPNRHRSIVGFREIIEDDLEEYHKMAIPVVLGKDILGKSQLFDLVKTPHLLIAGATGSGKSVCVNTMILSILFKRSPDKVRLILVDPKVVELKMYNDIPHLLTPVITEPKKALQALQYCICEMERRYSMLDKMKARDISGYNKKIEENKLAMEKMPYIVVIIDEFADLMATTGKELEGTIARLCAKSRAAGIHLVLATQRPSIDVITGLIKANIPSRIAFMVASKMDSRIIIDRVGAEMLLGKGDMLYASGDNPFPVRIQGTFVSDNDAEKAVEYVKGYGEPQYIDDEIFIDDDEDEEDESLSLSDGPDPLYDDAVNVVLSAGKASASYIQRKLKIGYNRAARLVEDMEAHGIVGPANGSKPRELLHIPA